MHWQDSGADAAYLIHDADSRFTAQFDAILKSEGVQSIRLHPAPPGHSPASPWRRPATPNMNAYAERWVQSVQTECLDHFVVLGERHLEHILRDYVAYYHLERPHQAKGNRPLSGHDSSGGTGPANPSPGIGRVVCYERLGGLLKHYTRQAA